MVFYFLLALLACFLNTLKFLQHSVHSSLFNRRNNGNIKNMPRRGHNALAESSLTTRCQPCAHVLFFSSMGGGLATRGGGLGKKGEGDLGTQGKGYGEQGWKGVGRGTLLQGARVG